MLVKIFLFLINIPLGILLLLLATIVFDILHVLLHRFAQSTNRVLRKIGALHTSHHQFLDTNLHIHDELIITNVFRHVVPEFIVQLIVTLAMMPLFPLPAIMVAIAIEVMVFIFIMWGKPGIDVNHKAIDQLKAYRPLYFCVPEYHLLHHVYPLAHFSSWIKTLDHFLSTGMALRGRRVLLTEAKTVFSTAMVSELENAGAIVTTHPDNAALKNAGILVLCHQPENDIDYQTLIERFYTLHQNDRIPVEVWALASTTEFDDARRKNYARFSSELFKAGKVIYRHMLVDDAISDKELAKKFVNGIRRGFNYVPSRCSVAMLKHYWQFVLK